MSLPRGHGDAVLTARFRASPEDFRVDEMPAFEAAGEGEHQLLTIEKRNLNTVSVVQRLAKWAGIGFEWRGLPFAWNSGGFDTAGGGKDNEFPDNKITDADQPFRFIQLLTVSFNI